MSGDKNEPPHHRRSGRSGNPGSPRNFSGGGGSTTGPPSSANYSGESFKKVVSYVPVAQDRVAGSNPNPNGSHVQPPLRGPAGASKAFPLQYGSISPDVINVMQVPARTSSAPPKDVLSSPSGPVAAHSQKHSGPPMPTIPTGVSMQMPFHQSQIHLPFGGPSPPMQAQKPIPLHLPVGNQLPQVPSQMGPQLGNMGGMGTPHGQPPGGILSGPMQSSGPQMQRSNSDSDRLQRASGYQKGLMPSPHTPMIHKAENRYEIGKVTDEEQAKQRQLKSILNKLTPQNFEKLFDQVKQVNTDNADTLSGVIGQIFDKALMEPTFVEMYAKFFSRLAVELPGFGEDSEKITFRRLLLNKCQEEFERGEREEEECEMKQSEEEREAKRVKARRRMLGNIRLIGELYKKRMLTERIMHECIKKMLRFNQIPNSYPDEENIEALCKLMSTIGEMIDHPKSKEHMDVYFDMMFELSNNMIISSRVRFMLKDAIDLRKNKWQQRRKVEGPKKIEEVDRNAFQRNFGPAEFQTPDEHLCSIKQTGSVQDYWQEFGERSSRVSNWPDHCLLGVFINGLKEQLKSEVRIHRPHTVYKAMSLALEFESKINHNQPDKVVSHSSLSTADPKLAYSSGCLG